MPSSLIADAQNVTTVLTVLWPGERFNRGVECNLDIAKIALEAFFLLIGSV